MSEKKHSTGNDDGDKHSLREGGGGGGGGDVNITCSCGFVHLCCTNRNCARVMRATMAATVQMGEAVVGGWWVGTYQIIPGYHTIRFKSNLVLSAQAGRDERKPITIP